MTVKEAVIKFLGSECLVENIPSDKLQKAVDYIALLASGDYNHYESGENRQN